MNEGERLPDESGYEAISCPYCGERIEVFIDSSVPEQLYIEDCQVCCRPITIRTQLCFDEQYGESIQVLALHENEY